MKRILSFVFAALLPWMANAYDFSYTHLQTTDPDVEVTLYYQFNPDGTSVSVALPPQPYKDVAIEIPSSVEYDGKTYSVTGIGASAFEKATTKSVVMANTITDVGVSAFSGSSVNDVQFSASLKSIGNGAFAGTSLKEANFPAGLQTIADNAFNGCYLLTKIILPESLTYIGAYAFYGANPDELNIPGGIGVIRTSAFRGHSSANHIESVTIGEGITAIEDYAFDFTFTRNVKFPSTLQSIGYRAFYESNILHPVELPEGLVSIGSQAFYRNYNLPSVKLPQSISSIGADAFGECSSLAEINFPGSLKTIAEKVCSYCKSLAKVTIEEGITGIEKNAFGNCKSLTSISLPESVETIGMAAFFYSGLTSFAFPSKVTEVSASMFQDCQNLTTVIIPDRITKIGSSAFANCSALTSLTLHDGLESIPAGMCSGCVALTDIKFPSGITTIGESAFRDCKSLAEINLPDKITKIYGYAFQTCNSLKSVSLPPLVEMLGNGVFRDCSQLETVRLSPALTSVGSDVVGNCQSLRSVYAPFSNPPSGSMLYGSNAATLYVPVGTKAAFESASGWNNFYEIKETDMADVQYLVSFSSNGYGKMLLNGASVWSSAKILSGKEASVTFVPTDGYMVKNVTLNGEDVTGMLADNTYTISSVDRNYDFNVVFARKPVTLSIHSGMAGTYSFGVEQGADFCLDIASAEGWEIESVRVGGVDYTESVKENDGRLELSAVRTDTDIYVTFRDVSGVPGVEARNVRIYPDAGSLIIEGLAAGAPYQVLDASGIVLASGVSGGNVISIDLPAAGTYVVATPAKTVKLAI